MKNKGFALMINEDFLSEQPVPRVVQYNKKRFAIRLERIFWRFLEKMAKKRKIRLGKLIFSLSEAHTGKNLSSYIRSYCMVEAEKELMQEHLSLIGTDAIDILKSCPVPGFILSHDLKILDYNMALTQWLGDTVPNSIRQFDLNDVFEPRVTRPVSETMALMQDGKLKQTQMQLVQRLEGRTSRSARSTWLALMPPKTRNFYCLVWLTSAPALSMRSIR